MANTSNAHNAHIEGNDVQGLDRISITLRPQGRSALNLAVDLTADNQTETINKALRLYSEYLQAERSGRGVYIRTATDILGEGGELERIRFL